MGFRRLSDRSGLGTVGHGGGQSATRATKASVLGKRSEATGTPCLAGRRERSWGSAVPGDGAGFLRERSEATDPRFWGKEVKPSGLAFGSAATAGGIFGGTK